MQFLSKLKISKTNNGVSTGLQWLKVKGEKIQSFSPVDGKLIGSVTSADKATYDKVIANAHDAFVQWRLWPAPKRGDIVRQIGESLRKNKPALGRLVSYEMGKIY